MFRVSVMGKFSLNTLNKALDITLVRCGFQLEEFLERLDLDFQEVWSFGKVFDFPKCILPL